MATLTKAICVWLDDVSDCPNARWVVSRDELDSDGGAVTTETLTIHTGEYAAFLAGKSEAKRLGLPLYLRGKRIA